MGATPYGTAIVIKREREREREIVIQIERSTLSIVYITSNKISISCYSHMAGQRERISFRSCRKSSATDSERSPRRPTVNYRKPLR